MKIYPDTSSLTVRRRIEQLIARRPKTAKDRYVTVYNNGTSEGTLFGFYLSDWDSPFDDIQLHKELDYRLDTESVGVENWHFGINFHRLEGKS
jgi:hypothetical protein